MGSCHTLNHKPNLLTPTPFFKNRSPPPFSLHQNDIIHYLVSKTPTGDLYKLNSPSTNDHHYIKFFIYSPELGLDEQTSRLSQEDAILQEVASIPLPYFLKYYGPYEIEEKDGENKIIVFKFEAGLLSLKELLLMRGLLSEEQVVPIFSSLVQAFVCLQEKNIAHRNIKTENIVLIYEEGRILFKIMDFSEAVKLKAGEEEISVNKKSISHEIMPELKSQTFSKDYNPFLADVYCLGLVICELLGVSPVTYQDEGNNDKHSLKELLGRMLNQKPIERAGFKEIQEYISHINQTNKQDDLHLETDSVIKWREKQISSSLLKNLKGLLDVGKLHLQLNHSKYTEEYFSKAEEIYLQVSNNPDISKYFDLSLGSYYNKEGNLDKAEEYYTSFLDLPIPPTERVECLKELVILYKRIGKSEERQKCYEKLNDIAKELVNLESKAEVFNLLGGFYLNIESLFDKSKQYFLESINILNAIFPKGNERMAMYLINMGNFHKKKNDYDGTMNSYMEALRMYESSVGEYSEGAANLLQNHILIEWGGDLAKVEELSAKLLRMLVFLYKETDKRIIQYWNNRIIFYKSRVPDNLMNPCKREENITKAYLKLISILEYSFENESNEQEKKRLVKHLMIYYKEFGLIDNRHKTTKEEQKYCQKLCEKYAGYISETESEYLDCLGRWGLVSYQAGDHNKAKEIFSKLAEIQEKIYNKDQVEVLETKVRLALIDDDFDNNEKTEEILQLYLQKSSSKHGGISENHLNDCYLVMKVYTQQKNYEKAEIIAIQAFEITGKNKTLIYAVPAALIKLGNVYVQLKNLEKAEEFYLRAERELVGQKETMKLLTENPTLLSKFSNREGLMLEIAETLKVFYKNIGKVERWKEYERKYKKLYEKKKKKKKL